MVLLRQLLHPPQNPQTTNQEGKRKQQEPDTKSETKKEVKEMSHQLIATRSDKQREWKRKNAWKRSRDKSGSTRPYLGMLLY